MEILGHISFKEILYCNVRTNQDWFNQLPPNKWIAFTIANDEDNELIADVAAKCLDKAVSCICCAGLLQSETVDSFGKEMIRRNVQEEKLVTRSSDNDIAPMITSHTNFSEGFWFATNIANAADGDQGLDIDKVICIDMTKHAVKRHLRELIGAFNSGELPSDSEFEEAVYDVERVMNSEF